MNDRHEGATFNLDQLLHPANAFNHPDQVLKDPDLTVNEKRAILASWASDACAVEAAPALRAAKDGAVRFDDIIDALKQLDGAAADRPQYGKLINRAERWKALFHKEQKARGPMQPSDGEIPIASASMAAMEMAKRRGGDGGRLPQ